MSAWVTPSPVEPVVGAVGVVTVVVVGGVVVGEDCERYTGGDRDVLVTVECVAWDVVVGVFCEVAIVVTGKVVDEVVGVVNRNECNDPWNTFTEYVGTRLEC